MAEYRLVGARVTFVGSTRVEYYQTISLTNEEFNALPAAQQGVFELVGGGATDEEVAAAKGLPIGLPGAVAPARFVGATTSGAPTTGTFQQGDYVVDQSGTMWVCVVAGSPGTWVDLSSGRELAYAEDKSNRTVNSTSLTDYPGLSISFPMPSNSRPVFIEAFIPIITVNAINATPTVFLHFATPNRVYGRHGDQHTVTTRPAAYNPKVRLPLVGDYEPAAEETVTCKVQWNTSSGSTATSTVATSGAVRTWPFLRAVAQ